MSIENIDVKSYTNSTNMKSSLSNLSWRSTWPAEADCLGSSWDSELLIWAWPLIEALWCSHLDKAAVDPPLISVYHEKNC